MSNTWQLQNAKTKLGAMIDCANDDGAQVLTVRGEAAVVVLSADDYEDTPESPTLHQRPGEAMLDWLKRSGVWAVGLDDELDLERDPTDVGRDVDLSD